MYMFSADPHYRSISLALALGSKPRHSLENKIGTLLPQGSLALALPRNGTRVLICMHCRSIYVISQQHGSHLLKAFLFVNLQLMG